MANVKRQRQLWRDKNRLIGVTPQLEMFFTFYTWCKVKGSKLVFDSANYIFERSCLIGISNKAVRDLY